MGIEYIPDWAPVDKPKEYEHFSNFQPGNQPSIPLS